MKIFMVQRYLAVPNLERWIRADPTAGRDWYCGIPVLSLMWHRVLIVGGRAIVLFRVPMQYRIETLE